MQNLYKLSILLVSSAFIAGCANTAQIKEPKEVLKTDPASNIAYSSTAKKHSERKTKGALQSGLDRWLNEEWEPAFQGDEEQVKKDVEADKHFSLQHYFDKTKKYLKKKEEEKAGEPKKPAHYETMQAMPVIGKP